VVKVNVPIVCRIQVIRSCLNMHSISPRFVVVRRAWDQEVLTRRN
jgi:hypothetical protein